MLLRLRTRQGFAHDDDAALSGRRPFLSTLLSRLSRKREIISQHPALVPSPEAMRDTCLTRVTCPHERSTYVRVNVSEEKYKNRENAATFLIVVYYYGDAAY